MEYIQAVLHIIQYKSYTQGVKSYASSLSAGYMAAQVILTQFTDKKNLPHGCFFNMEVGKDLLTHLLGWYCAHFMLHTQNIYTLRSVLHILNTSFGCGDNWKQRCRI